MRDIGFCTSLLEAFFNRSQAFEKRLDNEISLVSRIQEKLSPSLLISDVAQAFHLNSRRDSLQTNRIARVAHRDSEIMKGVSVLGLAFLPGTFVSVSKKRCCGHHVALLC